MVYQLLFYIYYYFKIIIRHKNKLNPETPQKENDYGCILLTDYLYGEQKTINDLFGKPKETTTVVVKSTDNELLLSHEVGADGVVILKIDIYFKLSLKDFNISKRGQYLILYMCTL